MEQIWKFVSMLLLVRTSHAAVAKSYVSMKAIIKLLAGTIQRMLALPKYQVRPIWSHLLHRKMMHRFNSVTQEHPFIYCSGRI